MYFLIFNSRSVTLVPPFHKISDTHVTSVGDQSVNGQNIPKQCTWKFRVIRAFWSNARQNVTRLCNHLVRIRKSFVAEFRIIYWFGE